MINEVWEGARWPDDGAEFDVLLGVTYEGAAYVLLAPDCVLETLDGPACHDNAFIGAPDAPGAWACTVRFWFRKSPDDPVTCDWGYRTLSARPIFTAAMMADLYPVYQEAR